MPVWMMKLVWRLRGKRRVRVHLVNTDQSIDGLLLGRWGGHYMLLAPSLVAAPGDSHALDGHVEIPTENVLFIQVATVVQT